MINNTFSWVNDSLEINTSFISGAGLGVFTTRDLPKGEVLMVMGGYIIDTDSHPKSLSGYTSKYDMDISERFSFSPLCDDDKIKMPFCLINHSCEPNCGFFDQLQIVAIRDLRACEEIVYDYAFVMWCNEELEHHFVMECKCGTSRCRGSVTEKDWMIPEIHFHYGQWFQPFLREKFVTVQVLGRKKIGKNT